MDVSSFTIDEIYDLYYAIAEKDHAFRLQSLYGNEAPPVGHCEFRPLCRESFKRRIDHYDALDQGQIGRSLRERLARQAAAYGVEYQVARKSLRRAA
ncbi:hypothetical protein [Allorhodopirellula heiligendammensis]|uniref:Uncharacterized protein n=1 Tax=Allorhodopirellula heiligendammensis TaxID=2714739 RepID=A0A5C6C559_9BACT|nr:hypothetical protein [Allorhodopirellula heiligendammensis]TWU19703.1 hypothetical protein Poly21_18780 [Allorhodopirellula heiligendammensis]|tara:strand:- start:284 stop:574 length:291 start_codon:yes stop_codon:yes gene_type:complete